MIAATNDSYRRLAMLMLNRVELSPALPTVPLLTNLLRDCFNCPAGLVCGLVGPPLYFSSVKQGCRLPPVAGPGAHRVHRSLPEDLRALDGGASLCDLLKRDTLSRLVLASSFSI